MRKKQLKRKKYFGIFFHFTHLSNEILWNKLTHRLKLMKVLANAVDSRILPCKYFKSMYNEQ